MIRLSCLALAAACLVVLATAPLPALAADGEGCTEALGELRFHSARYRSAQAQVRVIERDAPAGAMSAGEAALRSLRGLEAAERDSRDIRAQLLAIYRVLLERDCEPFDEEGFRTTASRFEALDKAGIDQIRKLRRRLEAEAQVQP